jgi:hypothetical protein
MTPALLLGTALLLLAGCTAPSPVPIPGPTAPSWIPDAVVQRDFDGTSCEARIRVVTASDSPTEGAAQQLIKAKAFLAAGDWSDVEVSLDDYPADQLEKMRDQGRTDANLLIGLVTDRIQDDLNEAGLSGPGLTTQGFVNCEAG